MLLAIDTASPYASVAVHDGERLLAELVWLANQDHTRTLLSHVQQALADAGAGVEGLTAVAVALGPGSFNGLRVGLSTAKGLAIARGVRLVGASTLELLALEYGPGEPLNAGRGRMYRGQGESIELVEGTAPERVRHAGVLAELGWRRLREGRALDPTHCKPIYVQEPRITPSRKKAHMQAA